MSPHSLLALCYQGFPFCDTMCNQGTISRQPSIAHSQWKVAGSTALQTKNLATDTHPATLLPLHWFRIGVHWTSSSRYCRLSTVSLNHCLTRAGHFQHSFSPLGWHEKHKQSRKQCCLLFCFYCLLHIQRGPWCPFPYLSSIFWAQNSNSVTRSYGINKEMNHNSLDEDRALEPSNPQCAHVYRHGRCCCWFYLRLGNAGLRLQQGKAISRQMHVLQWKLVLFAGQGSVSLVQKDTLSNQAPNSWKDCIHQPGTLARILPAAPVHQHCPDLWNAGMWRWAGGERKRHTRRNDFPLRPAVLNVLLHSGGIETLWPCFIFLGDSAHIFSLSVKYPKQPSPPCRPNVATAI